MIARGSHPGSVRHVDLDWPDDMDGTTVTVDSGGSPSPWNPATWFVTSEATRIAERYLSSKTLAEQVAVTSLIAEIERIGLPPVRSRTTTDNVPFLQRPGAGHVLGAQWLARLEGAK